jgi:hypothetical protein
MVLGVAHTPNVSGRNLPKLFGVWATPFTIRNLPNQGESK